MMKRLMIILICVGLVWGFFGSSESNEPVKEPPAELQERQTSLLAKAEKGTADEETMSALLDVSIDLDDLDTAVSWGRKAVEKYPKNPSIKIKTADALQRKMNKAPMTWMTGKEEYIGLLEAAIELDPKNPMAYYFLNGFYLGAPGFVGGSVEKALEVANRLRRHDEIEGSLALTQVYLKQGDEKAWRRTFAQLLGKHASPKVRYQFGMALQRSETYEEAIEQFSKAADQGHLNSLYQLGRTYVIGRFEWRRAVEAFDRFIRETEGTDHHLIGGAWWRKGQAHEALGELEMAHDCLKKALELDPTLKHAGKDLARVSKKLGG